MVLLNNTMVLLNILNNTMVLTWRDHTICMVRMCPKILPLTTIFKEVFLRSQAMSSHERVLKTSQE